MTGSSPPPERSGPSETFALRREDSITLTEDGVYVDRADGETVFAALDDVVEIQHESVDWFIAILSVCLLGFGLYSTTEHVLGGLGFAAAGVASLYLVYRKRGAISFKVTNRPKPLTVYPEHPERVYRALGALMDED